MEIPPPVTAAPARAHGLQTTSRLSSSEAPHPCQRRRLIHRAPPADAVAPPHDAASLHWRYQRPPVRALRAAARPPTQLHCAVMDGRADSGVSEVGLRPRIPSRQCFTVGRLPAAWTLPPPQVRIGDDRQYRTPGEQTHYRSTAPVSVPAPSSASSAVPASSEVWIRRSPRPPPMPRQYGLELASGQPGRPAYLERGSRNSRSPATAGRPTSLDMWNRHGR